jgi:hypothetical protein
VERHTLVGVERPAAELNVAEGFGDAMPGDHDVSVWVADDEIHGRLTDGC